LFCRHTFSIDYIRRIQLDPIGFTEKVLTTMWTQIGEFVSPSGLITCVRFSPDGSTIVISTSSGFISVRSPTQDLSEIATRQFHPKSINDVKWSFDSRLILTCSDDGSLLLSRLSDLATVCEFRGHHSYVVACDISPNALRVASGSYDESVRIWDSASGKCLRMISAHSEPVTAVCFSRDGMFVLSSSWDGYCRIWLAHSGICFKSFELSGVPICFSLFTPNNHYVMVSCRNSAIKLIRIRDSNSAAIFRGHVNDRYCLFAGFCMAPGNISELYTASEDGTIVGYDVATQEVVWRVTVCEGPTLCGDISMTGEMLVTGSSTEQCKAVKLWRRMRPGDG
jgi:COMPASS component SWD3